MQRRIAITGAAGRMGRTLIQMVHEADDLVLSGALERADSSLLGSDAGELAGIGRTGIRVSADAQEVCAVSDVLIDFSVPAATLVLLPQALRQGCQLVIGTTGFEDSGLETIREAAAETAILMAPNMSVGVNLLFHLVGIAARALGDGVDVEVLEAHHRHKVDAPSGTAMRLGEVLAESLDRDLQQVAVFGREGITGARPADAIGFATVRAGDIVGDHTVLFAGAGERLELTHRAHSRANFAEGALRAVRFLAGQKRGLYSMQDVLGFS